MLCVGFLGEKIQDFAGDGSRFGSNVAYSFDGPVLLGTAGALRQALPLLGDRWFFVLYGDSFCPAIPSVSSRPFLAIGSKKALMTVLRNETNRTRVMWSFRDGRILAYDKRSATPEMRSISTTASGYSRDAIAARTRRRAFRPAHGLSGRLAREGWLAGCEVHERFYEIGSFEGMRRSETTCGARENLSTYPNNS